MSSHDMLVAAASRLLAAREDQMVTSREWEDLALALGGCAGPESPADNPPRFQPGQRVSIRMMACDSTHRVAGEGPVQVVKDTAGTGIVLGRVPDEALGNLKDEFEGMQLYHVAVITGRFDAHRNDMGQLACWDYELAPDPDGRTAP